MGLIIHILTNDGSPLGVSLRDLWGEGKRGIGIGGAEYGLLTLCEEWHNAGHEVILYNDPLDPNGSPFEQRPINAFNPSEKRDIVIIFRSPNPKGIIANGLKIWWSTDQYTIGSFQDFAPHVQKIVTISPFHTEYFKQTYGITNTIPIDLPIRVKDMDGICDEKEPYRLIFTSVPDRGLPHLWGMWPAIKQEVPQAMLVITSDYRLWGLREPRNDQHRQQWISREGYMFLGAIPRRRLIEEQLKAQIIAYPCLYDELFCISVAEAQVCGVYPVTSSTGALISTNMGKVIPGNPGSVTFNNEFVGTIVSLLIGQEVLKQRQEEVKKKAIERFHPSRILEQWDRLVFG